MSEPESIGRASCPIPELSAVTKKSVGIPPTVKRTRIKQPISPQPRAKSFHLGGLGRLVRRLSAVAQKSLESVCLVIQSDPFIPIKPLWRRRERCFWVRDGPARARGRRREICANRSGPPRHGSLAMLFAGMVHRARYAHHRGVASRRTAPNYRGDGTIHAP